MRGVPRIRKERKPRNGKSSWKNLRNLLIWLEESFMEVFYMWT